MLLPQPRAEQQDLPVCIPRQEGMQEVRLVPVTALVQPLRRVSEWPEDVMDMHGDTGRKARKDVQQEPANVRPGLGDMRRVDEQDVSSAKLPELCQRHILYRYLMQGERIAGPQ